MSPHPHSPRLTCIKLSPRSDLLRRIDADVSSPFERPLDGLAMVTKKPVLLERVRYDSQAKRIRAHLMPEKQQREQKVLVGVRGVALGEDAGVECCAGFTEESVR